MSKPKRYCEGIDCSWCDEKEPCIYKIANELEYQLNKRKAEDEALKNNDVFSIRLFKDKADKYKQALEEIKSLCYQQNLDEDFFACEVLQKISEVIDER